MTANRAGSSPAEPAVEAGSMNRSRFPSGAAALAAMLAPTSCLIEPARHREPFSTPLIVEPAQPVAPPAAPAPGHAAREEEGGERAEIPVVIRDEAVHSLELRGAELGQAFNLIAGMAGLNLVLVGDFSPTVAASFPAVRLQSAFASLCDVHDCEVEPQGDILRISRPDPGRPETRIFELENVAVATVEPQVKSMLDEGAIVVGNPSNNVLHVSSTPDMIRRAADWLDAVDRTEKQVLIECRVLEVNETDAERLGVEVSAADISLDDTTWSFVSSFFSSATPTLIATGAADHSALDAALEALASRIRLRVLSRPNLLSLNNKEAKLEVVQEVPYVQATTSTTGSNTGTGTVTVQEVQFKEVGLKLTITPAIQEDGRIALHLAQEISEQTGVFLEVPVVDKRLIDNWFLVKEGDTLRLGGILKDRKSHTVRGIPLLMDIPWLGRVFRFEEDVIDQIDLEIFITPRLVESPPAGATSAARVEVGAE